MNAADRKRLQRGRAKQGLVLVSFWVDKQHAEAIADFVDALPRRDDEGDVIAKAGE